MSDSKNLLYSYNVKVKNFYSKILNNIKLIETKLGSLVGPVSNDDIKNNVMAILGIMPKKQAKDIAFVQDQNYRNFTLNMIRSTKIENVAGVF